jgi:hypothetical protein
MGNRLTALLILCALSFVTAAEKGYISGTVTNRHDGLALEAVNVMVQNTLLGASTDRQGVFHLTLAPGRYVLQFSMIGFARQVRPVSVATGQTVELTVQLQEETIVFSGRVVESGRFEASQTHQAFVIEVAPARNIPPLGEPDLFSALKTLPGVMNNNDMRGEVHVRGGGADQNLILLDGVEVYNPYHLYGIFSTFNIDALDGAELHIGSFPVEYGGRISSVVDIRTKSSQKTTTANISLLSSNGVFFRKWKNTSLLAALRRSYLDLISPVNYNFTDGHLKFTGSTGDFTMKVFGYLTADRMKGTLYEKDAGEPKTNASLGWGNRIGGIHVTWTRNRHMLSGLISISTNSLHYSGIENKIKDISGKLDYRLTLSHHFISTGFQLKSLDTHYAWDDSGSNGHDIKTFLFPSAPMFFKYEHLYKISSCYIADRLNMFKFFSVEGGVRRDTYKNLELTEPRIGLLWRTPLAVNIKANAGCYHQYFSYGEEAREGSIANLFFSTERPVNGVNYSAGLDGALFYDIRYEVEVYQRHIKNVCQFTEPFPAFEFGSARLYGLDILLEKSTAPLTFQLAYSYLSTNASFRNQNYPFDWEARHTFSGLTGFQVRKGWFLNCFVTFHSGLPLTPVDGVFHKVNYISISELDRPYRNVQSVYLEGPRNSGRLPYYLRLDLCIRKKYVKSKYSYTIYAQVINALGRENPLRYDWNLYYTCSAVDEEGHVKQLGGVHSMPTIPSIGVQYEF